MGGEPTEPLAVRHKWRLRQALAQAVAERLVAQPRLRQQALRTLSRWEHQGRIHP